MKLSKNFSLEEFEYSNKALELSIIIPFVKSSCAEERRLNFKQFDLLRRISMLKV